METRKRWIEFAMKLAGPVLSDLQGMPVTQRTGEGREECTHLEALCRTLAGIAPYLHSFRKVEPEAAWLFDASVEALCTYPWHLNISKQNIVDLGYLAQAFHRCPDLWNHCHRAVNLGILKHMFFVRKEFRPIANNWLVQNALIDAWLTNIQSFDLDVMGVEVPEVLQPNLISIDYALKQSEYWYVGDGWYKDGPNFQMSYYNSLVFHPGLCDILDLVSDLDSHWDSHSIMRDRCQHHAEWLERIISPEGTFPSFGRSATYRMGVFYALGYACLHGYIGDNTHGSDMEPAQVRCALDAVLQKMEPHMFDRNGWLEPGFMDGYDVDLMEPYISTGSAYATALFLLPLGLPVDSEFWKDEDQDWTQKKLWSGQQVSRDKAFIYDRKPRD